MTNDVALPTSPEPRLRESIRHFLLTDILGSTNLFEQHPDDMFRAMEVHDRVLLQAIQGHGGSSFKHTGDGMWAVFDDPEQALRAAVEIQQNIGSVSHGHVRELTLRVGVNSGPARPRSGDYFGPGLNATARLESAANGGQILTSASTLGLVADEHIGDLAFIDLGDHRFKGIEPIQVFQVNGAGLPTDFGPLGGKREADVGNLPVDLSTFFGRRSELAGLVKLVMDSRVTTLLGPGGTGKSRLSIEVARALQPQFADGAWFIELASIEQGRDVWLALANALEIPSVPDLAPREQVLDRVRGSESLLVVDNCEHLLEHCADAVQAISGVSPGVRILTSSRRVLAVTGEAIFDVSPLEEVSNEAHVEAPAVQLFIERGRLVRHDFDPSPDELRVIRNLCVKLDHLPLAIEIAAANVRRLSVAQIDERAADPLAMKASRHRRAFGRQQTVRQTLDWSYELLDEVAADVLDTLCVFAGSFIEPTGVALCEAVGLDENDVVEALDELIDSSLLAKDASDRNRFRILELVKAYGRERLQQAGRLEAAERAHVATNIQRVQELSKMFDSANEADACRTLLTELPDLRAAFDRVLPSSLEEAAALTAPLFYFNYVHRGSPYAVWAGQVAAQPGADDLRMAPIVFAAAAGHALHAGGDLDGARSLLERAKAAEARHSDSSEGWVDGVMGQLDFWTGDIAGSAASHLRAADAAESVGNASAAVVELCMGSYSFFRAKDNARAEELLGRATGIAGDMNPTAIGHINFGRGMVEAMRNPERALDELEMAANWALLAENEHGANRVRRLMSEIRAGHAEPEEALEIHARALFNFPERGDAIHAWSTIGSLLGPLGKLGSHDDVALLVGALRKSPVPIDHLHRRSIDRSRAAIGPDAFEAGAAQGAEMGLAQVRRHVTDRYLGMREGRG